MTDAAASHMFPFAASRLILPPHCPHRLHTHLCPFLLQPENKVAMLQHPEYVPELLRNPDGFVRQTACEAARKGGQSKAIVDAVCAPDNEVPWPVAEALHGTDHLNFVSGAGDCGDGLGFQVAALQCCATVGGAACSSAWQGVPIHAGAPALLPLNRSRRLPLVTPTAVPRQCGPLPVAPAAVGPQRHQPRPQPVVPHAGAGRHNG